MVPQRSSRRSFGGRSPRRSLGAGLFIASTCFAMLWIGSAQPARAQCVSVNLDGDLVCNLAESKIELIQTSAAAPVGYCDRVTNGVVGGAFTFEWPTAGPGGVSGWTGVGSAEGSGYIWRWETVSQIHQLPCGAINVPCMSFINSDTLVQRGPFTVPGLTTTPGNVTASSESLTASYLSFFSPPKEQLRVDTKVQQLQNGQFLIETRMRNLTANRLAFEMADVPHGGSTPPRACGSDRVRCGGVCCSAQDCRFEADGFICDAPPGGACEGTTCGTDCVDIESDELHCGSCFSPCPPGNCCGQGACVPCDFPGIIGSLDSGFLAPGSESVNCQISDTPAKEVLTQMVAFCEPDAPVAPDGSSAPRGGVGGCALGGSGVRGMLNVFVPDESIVIEPDVGVFLSVPEVGIADPNGNGFVEPGEFVELQVQLINAGPATLTNVVATLSSASVDLNGDGDLDNVLIPANASSYGPVQGVVPSAVPMDCTTYLPLTLAPSVNTLPFTVLIPAAHPVGTAREFELLVTADANPASGGASIPFMQQVKFALAITESVPIVQSDDRSAFTRKSAAAPAAICPCSQVSNCVIAPSPCLLYFEFENPDRIVFSPVADTHDLLYGDLSSLLSSAGDYSDSNATLGCLASMTAFNFVDFATDPAIGEGFWFLARGTGGGYETGEASQIDPRDGEIGLSANHCPPP